MVLTPVDLLYLATAITVLTVGGFLSLALYRASRVLTELLDVARDVRRLKNGFKISAAGIGLSLLSLLDGRAWKGGEK